MQRRERQFARLLRALIACVALLLAGAAPALPFGSAADVSGWGVAQMSAPAAACARSAARHVRSRTAAPRPASARAFAAAAASPGVSSPAAVFLPPTPDPRSLRERRRARRDGRDLYLEIQTLLC